MRASNFRYLMKEGARSIWVNRLMSFASIGVLIACLLLIGGAILIGENVKQVIGYVQDQNEMVVFLNEDVTSEELQEIDQEMNSLEGMLSVTFISKAEALKNTQEEMGDTGDLLAGYEDAMLDSYVLKLRDISQMQQIADLMKTKDYVYEVYAPLDVALTLTSVQQIVSIFGMGIVVILGVVSLIMIANTIKISVFSRRKEVNIMKFVGATNSFIRLPFVVEGVLLGLISAVISYGILWFGYTKMLDWLTSSQSAWLQGVSSSMLPFSTMALPLLGGFIAAGVLIGVFGSLLFVRKHLKV